MNETPAPEPTFRTADFVAFLASDPILSDLLDGPALKRLVDAGRTSPHDIYEAGILPAATLAEALSRFHGIARVGDGSIVDDPALLNALSPRFLRAAWLYPFRDGETVVIACADPGRQDEIAAVRLALGSEAPLKVASFDVLAGRFENVRSDRPAGANAAADTAARDSDERPDVERLQDLASGAPIVQALDGMLEAAIEAGATDIHIEPDSDGARVRLRIDGVLRSHDRLTPQMARGVVSRAKILCGLNIAERRLPQDGRARLSTANGEADVRAATAPTLHGEALVMRLLLRQAHALDLARLGMGSDDLVRFRARLAEPHGLIVVTGPTGSGKTTTLTAAMAALNTPERKIITIEDPIEYQIPGVNQTQVKPAIALTFATALRSFLRHDPDVLMVGEMRDSETAAVGVQAALTGHLVLTTLHTNSAADALTRLIDLKVERFLIGASLKCVVGQRLVRRLCEHCRRPAAYPPPEAGAYLADGRLKGQTGATVHAADGCARCGQTGFRGRIGIFEVLTVDGTIRDLLREGAGAGEIDRAARNAGMTAMIEDGFDKVCRGLTTFSEVIRATA
jgi:general secretion pathway protein E